MAHAFQLTPLARRFRSSRGVRCLQLLVFVVAAIAGFGTSSIAALDHAFIPVSTRWTAGQQHLAPASGADSGSTLAALVAAAVAGSVDPQVASAASDAGVEGSPLVPVFGVLAFLGFGVTAILLSAESGREAEDDKKVVTEYFNGEGFNRWSRIYSESGDVNPVQKDIRVGHAQTVDKILTWLDSNSIQGKTVCDAGCGTGSLSIPLASRGAKVSGSDISSAMVGEAEQRAKESLTDQQMPVFKTSDLEALDGEYDCVCCVDVLIHYPPEKMEGMVRNLARLSKDRVILSFAPKTWYYTLLKRIGELFPGKSKTTRAYLHEEELVEQAFRAAGFSVTRKEMTATNFYFSRLFEAKPMVAASK